MSHLALSACSAKNCHLWPPFLASQDANFAKFLVDFRLEHTLSSPVTVSSLSVLTSVGQGQGWLPLLGVGGVQSWRLGGLSCKRA